MATDAAMIALEFYSEELVLAMVQDLPVRRYWDEKRIIQVDAGHGTLEVDLLVFFR